MAASSLSAVHLCGGYLEQGELLQKLDRVAGTRDDGTDHGHCGKSRDGDEIGEGCEPSQHLECKPPKTCPSPRSGGSESRANNYNITMENIWKF
ncbi:hypothetical protein RRF57_004419 [Xylaria bambusicola]|uniref:Uncharacterized protein n=1 Tax=Xylaria bambusicola TaxID=326684 RepID=A0AAN7UHZ5_9PEZI